MRTLKELTQLCKNASAIWEESLEFVKKLKLIDFIRKLSAIMFSEVFSLSVTLFMLSLSFSATQQTLTSVWDLFCLRVLKRQIIFTFNLNRCAACFIYSFIVSSILNFRQRYAQLRDSNNTEIHKQL